jgi:hypothetical protein
VGARPPRNVADQQPGFRIPFDDCSVAMHFPIIARPVHDRPREAGAVQLGIGADEGPAYATHHRSGGRGSRFASRGPGGVVLHSSRWLGPSLLNATSVGRST